VSAVRDTFTGADGTLLSAHAGELGAAWTLHPSYTGTLQLAGNRLRATSTTATAYYASGVPSGAEYDVTATITRLSGSVNSIGILGRMDTAANTFYMARYSPSAWQLFKFVNGVSTQLGSAVSDSFPDTRTVTLEIRDAAKKLFVDGVERISSPDNVITAAGRVGVRDSPSVAPTDSTGFHLDNLVASVTAASKQVRETGIWVSRQVLARSAGAWI
jgi:hypothetical protein